ncbi:MAG: hypothetical protein JOZ99_13825 [Actinobacteria bacterium]|nr:hypothetical protein [Actinomycetota bacterium]
MGVVAVAVAGVLVVVAAILVIMSVRIARQVPALESLVAPDDATLRLDRSRRVVAVDDRAHALLGWTEAELSEPGAFDRRVLQDDRSAGARDITGSGGASVPVVYREVAVPGGSVVVVRDRRPAVALEARAAENAREAADAEQRRAEQEARAHELDGQIARLEHQLSLETTPRGLAEALWRLELLRQRRAGWVRGPVPGGDELTEPAARLAASLATELELLREDVGTYAELGEAALGPELDAGFALSALRMAQELLAAVAKRSESIVVTVRSAPDCVGLTVSCAGWTADGDATSALDAIAAAAIDLGGTLTITEDGDTLATDVSLPRPTA